VAAALAAPSPRVELPERGLEFVGAGPNQWTAAEGALKVREAAHLFTEGLSVEQLRQGPGFALGSRDALVSLDGGGPSAARPRKVAAAVEAAGSRVYRIATTELGEPLSIFSLTVAVQRIALDFALRLGTDPDDVGSTELALVRALAALVERHGRCLSCHDRRPPASLARASSALCQD
jgi:glucosamine--fructose-6-phosphate aminotransferase (isomerizing)